MNLFRTIFLGGLLVAVGFVAATVFFKPANPPPLSKVGVLVSAFCESVTNTDNELMNISGLFDSVYAAEFPAVRRNCSLALRLLFTRENFGKHQVQIRFLDSDGKQFRSDINTEISVSSKRKNALVTADSEVVKISELLFQKEGTYFVQVWIDGELLTTLNLSAWLDVRPA